MGRRSVRSAGSSIMLCQKLNLFSGAVVAVDGSKFKAVNTRDKNFTPAKIAKRKEQIDASIERYLSALDASDRQDGGVAQAKSVRLKEKIASLREQMKRLAAFALQAFAQRWTTASNAVVVMSAESVFGALAAAVALDECPSARVATGALVILVAIAVTSIRRTAWSACSEGVNRPDAAVPGLSLARPAS